MKAMKIGTLLGLGGLLGCGGTTDGPAAGLYEPAQRYEPRAGDGTITYTSTDVITPERTLALRVRVPQGAPGPLPVVIVAHGGGFNDNGHTRLADWGATLATAGYLAINFANASDEAIAHCAPLQIPAVECMGAERYETQVADGGTLPASFYTRPHDVRAILDRLDGIAAAAGVTWDPERVAVLGHSAGAHAVMALAGAVIDVSPSVHAMPVREPRLKAYVANSPQGVGDWGLTATSWDPIAVPMLIQTGRGDATAETAPAARLEPFEHLAGPDAYQHYVDVEGDATSHDVFALEHAPGVDGIELAVATTAIAFLDAYVRDRAEAKAWLASDALAEATGGLSVLSAK